MNPVVLNGRAIDLDKALPLTVGDWRGLKKRGLTPQALAVGADFDAIATLVHYVLAKADPSVTEGEVDALAPASPEFRAIMAALKGQAEDGDRPSAEDRRG